MVTLMQSKMLNPMPRPAELQGLAMPAEWAPHERTIIAFPNRREQWGNRLREGQQAWAHVARTIAEFEPVSLLATARDAETAAELAAHPNVTIVEMPLNDAWLRDTAPIYVTGPAAASTVASTTTPTTAPTTKLSSSGKRRVGLDFTFNGWGNKYVPHDDDDRIPSRWTAHNGDERYQVNMILEGGSITVDGDGTVVTTEQCLLNPNRNPHLSRREIEDTLCASLGVTKVIWVPYAIDDRDTDGHIDIVAAFIEPGKILWQGCDNPHDAEYTRLAISRRCLNGAADAAGRALKIVDVPVLPYVEIEGERLPAPYANLYICNGAVIVPVTGHPADDDMLSIIADAWPDRKIVGVPGDIIAYGGGGPHCITQQIPAI
jgi:agmatine deiminase